MPPQSKFLSSLKSPVAAKHKKPSVSVSKKTPVKASAVYKNLIANSASVTKVVPAKKFDDESSDDDDELIVPVGEDEDEDEDEEVDEHKETQPAKKDDDRFNISKLSKFAQALEDVEEVRFDDDDVEEAEEDEDTEEDDEEAEDMDAGHVQVQQEADEEDEDGNEEDEEEEEEEEEEKKPVATKTASKTTAVSTKTAVAPKAVSRASAAAEESDDEDEALLSLSVAPSQKTTSTVPTTSDGSNAAPTVEAKKPVLDVHSLKAKKKAEAYLEKQRQRGICFISRIPPQMGPKRMRMMLSVYGDIDRIFLQPEDVVKTLKRKKLGGGGKRYDGGWVEFLDKRKAKRAALLLHGTPMAAKKRDKFANDLWQIKYLSGVKWEDLRLQHMHEKEMREAALRSEIMQAKKEASEYVEKVEAAAKRQKMMEAKKRRGEEMPAAKVMRTFHQRHAISKAKDFDDE